MTYIKIVVSQRTLLVEKKGCVGIRTLKGINKYINEVKKMHAHISKFSNNKICDK